ncbi:MAG: Uma2 family endonuclease [Cyanobium sp.]
MARTPVGCLMRWQALTAEQRRSFPPLCPELVIELVSPSGEGVRGAEALRRRMTTYLANGARLGWLLFPMERAVEIWRAEAAAGGRRGDGGRGVAAEAAAGSAGGVGGVSGGARSARAGLSTRQRQ